MQVHEKETYNIFDISGQFSITLFFYYISDILKRVALPPEVKFMVSHLKDVCSSPVFTDWKVFSHMIILMMLEDSDSEIQVHK